MKQNRLIQSIFIVFLLLSACQTAEEKTERITETTPKITKGMLQHTVYFYLNDDVTDEQKKEFEEEGLKALLSIDEVAQSQTGIPADTPDRDVTDHSFGYSIVVWFDNREDYMIYAEHPDHMEFIDKYSSLWADVKVYDSQITATMD